MGRHVPYSMKKVERYKQYYIFMQVFHLSSTSTAAVQYTIHVYAALTIAGCVLAIILPTARCSGGDLIFIDVCVADTADSFAYLEESHANMFFQVGLYKHYTVSHRDGFYFIYLVFALYILVLSPYCFRYGDLSNSQISKKSCKIISSKHIPNVDLQGHIQI